MARVVTNTAIVAGLSEYSSGDHFAFCSTSLAAKDLRPHDLTGFDSSVQRQQLCNLIEAGFLSLEEQ